MRRNVCVIPNMYLMHIGHLHTGEGCLLAAEQFSGQKFWSGCLYEYTALIARGNKTIELALLLLICVF